MSTSASPTNAGPLRPGYILMEYGKRAKVVKKPDTVKSAQDIRTLAASLFSQIALAPPAEEGFDIAFYTTTMPERPGRRVPISAEAIVEVWPVISDLEMYIVNPYDCPPEDEDDED
ncbi:hypothetical protein FA13DRAFT_1741215 [Coprinellus micaceus]|uniref:Uncharacterized protein n=1 Tax=Coprinellus micaceus TaxID=71717 RepID=A0A4Y7SJZ5_COPMI|nr:hypothetical protein FA13DRAFT_1741215 [Coprinellus micaceus]